MKRAYLAMKRADSTTKDEEEWRALSNCRAGRSKRLGVSLVASSWHLAGQNKPMRGCLGTAFHVDPGFLILQVDT